MTKVNRMAVVVLATGDYWKGAKVLFHTLRKYGKLPDSVDRIVLGAPMDSTYATAVPIDTDYSWIPVHATHFPAVADKFLALTLEYDRIILMDADMLCLGDCSYLWSDTIGQLPFYAVRDVASIYYYEAAIKRIGLDHTRLFNGGVMIFQKNHLGVTFLSSFLQDISEGRLKAYDAGDQGYLNHYFQRTETEIGYLPEVFNACLDAHFPDIYDKRIVHFTGGNVNPWNPSISSEDRRWPLVQRWQREWKDCNV